ncbi:hypothetical protein BGZ58_007472, partial [Dissophora ornata]
HPRIKRLNASIKQVFKPDSKSPDAPSLLVHFPALQTWDLLNSPDLLTLEAIKREVGRCCPMLTAVYTETPVHTTTQMLLHIFRHLTELCISHREMSPELILAIITHRKTLEHVRTALPYPGFYDQDEVPEVSNSLQDLNWMIQMIPQLCSSLKSIHFCQYELKMDEIDSTKWTCRHLTSLHIRIRDLDTKEEIDRAIRMWIDGCRKRSVD